MEKKRFGVAAVAMCCMLCAGAQQLKSAYVDWGETGVGFSKTLRTWMKGVEMTEDDNFFISRVRPKLRFRNVATQINMDLNEANDKHLCFWVPVNKPPYNALPDGAFDREVFPMWPYITHWGNWTAPFVRMPGGFADVAHKNGVGVSVLASIPYGDLNPDTWGEELTRLVNTGADRMSDFLEYYGVDGLGYNSEFDGGEVIVPKLQEYHEKIVANLKTTGRMPLLENIWYDGTTDNGYIWFDRGLSSYNDGNFGDGEHPRTSLFLNYNWNQDWLIDGSIEKAVEMGRDPLDLYCGFNMQGAEPSYYPTRWPLLVGKNLSIGLWGAHSSNMFFESRGEKGAAPDVQQRTYMLRVERWFTGGTRNPVNTPEVSNSMKYNADNFDFFGMSKFMTARSSLKWNLSDEPFITYFNLGNGKFFNWEGKRQNDGEWYNIGIQDYLPTWRWWFADKFLGRMPEDVPETGLDAEFVWDDAWMGGSLMRVYGSSANEYLHLFKTEFALSSGDEIAVRYKVMGGSADMSLALSAKGDEETVLAESSLSLMEKSAVRIGGWVEKKFRVEGDLNVWNGKELAMVALHITNADNLNLYLGEFSIVRIPDTSVTPAQPVVRRTAVLGANCKGVDGKIIFEMPNDKGNEVCYNLDVNTSLFKLYAQQKGKSGVLMGATTSWAGLYFAVPFDFTADGQEVRFGVSAVSLDMASESAIAWGDYLPVAGYEITDDVTMDKTTVKPGESFEVAYMDDLHEPACWEILDKAGSVVKREDGVRALVVAEGLPEVGVYSLRLTGKVAKDDARVDSVRLFNAYIQITDERIGANPEILSLLADGKDTDITADVDTPVKLTYTGREAGGAGSRGMKLEELGFGFKTVDMGITDGRPFSIAFWLKINRFYGTTQLMSICDRADSWPQSNWGWLWSFLNGDGTMQPVVIRGTNASGKNIQYNYGKTKFETGVWYHVAYVFDYNDAGEVHFSLYVNGVKQEVTAWSHGGDTNNGEPGYEGNLYPMRTGNVLSVGGKQSSSGGIDGTIDNFQYWDKAMTQEDVDLSMGDLVAGNLPEHLAGFWSMEQSETGNGSLANEASGHETVLAGRFSYLTGDTEGSGTICWEPALYAAGCPFLEGSTFVVETVPKWTVENGILTDVSGDDVAGEATASFAEDGIYSVTLTLENDLGKDTRTLPCLMIGDVTAVGQVKAEETLVYPNPFADRVFIRFANAGNYRVAVYNAVGVLVGGSRKDVDAGGVMDVNVRESSGVYLLHVWSGDKLVRTIKLLKQE